MIIARTPFRISFFGGGTDYPVWYREHGGVVLATTINKYCYITCRYLPPFFDYISRIVYSKVETVRSNEEIKHYAIRGTLKAMEITQGVEIHHDGDLPGRSGLGSSSSFTVGLLHALFALKRTMPTKQELAAAAIDVEHNVLKENVGCQDQVLAAYGGFVRIDFPVGSAGSDFQVTPLILSRERLQEFQDHLLLYYTGITRIASDIAKEQLDRTRENSQALFQITQMVDEAVRLLTGSAPLTEVGSLLHEGWLLKRSLSPKVSTSQIDTLYEEARRAGAIGGKLLGAGGGGFMLLLAKPEDHAKIQERLKSFLLVPFSFENHGSQIVLYDPDPALEDQKRVRPSTNPILVQQ